MIKRYFISLYPYFNNTINIVRHGSAPSLTHADITTSFTPASTQAFDGVVLNNNLYLAWNGASSSGLKMAYISGNSLTVTSTLAIVTVNSPAPGTVQIRTFDLAGNSADLNVELIAIGQRA